MVYKSVWVAAALAAGLATVPASSKISELVVNGGFENTGFGGTSSYYNLGDTSGDHATPADFGFLVPFNNVDIVANGVYGPTLANGGAYNLDLVGYGSDGAILQFFATRAGAHYTLSFDYSSNNGAENPGAVVFSGSGIDAFVVGTHAWQHFSGTLIGAGPGSDGVVFYAVDSANNAGVFLDNISVTGNAIPEPATWALMVAGFGLVGAATRRRAAAVAV